MARGSGLRKSLATKFDDELRFFKGWMDKPKAVGSIIPTSSVTARRMASIIDLGSKLPVLELGPGTGVVTRAILKRGVKPVSNRVADSEGPPDFWASEYTVAKIGPHPAAPFPTANEVGR